MFSHRHFIPLLCAALVGCAGSQERRVSSDLSNARERLETGGPPSAHTPVEGTLDRFVAHAVRHSPSVRAAFEEWRAAALSISRTRRLPEPRLTYGLYLQQVETRVGPQRHRLGISQSFPWPTELTAAADAATESARAAGRRFEGAVLAVRHRVAREYWELWSIDRQAVVLQSQQRIIEGLAGAVRTRVETGGASLADMAQVGVNLSRTTDALEGLDERARRGEASLRAAIGAAPDTPVRIQVADVLPALPAQNAEALRRRADGHPGIGASERMAASHRAASRRADARGMPGFTLGLDYIETGEAAQPGVPESGKDPIIAMVSVKLPLWFGSYDDEAQAEQARAAAFDARAQAARDEAGADVASILSRLRDSARRMALYRTTLTPQARAAYDSVLSAYTGARGSVAAVLLAQRDLLQIELDLISAQAAHARAWAHLEHVVGEPIAERRTP